MATQKKTTKTATAKPLKVCTDRPLNLMNAPNRMLHSIRHNTENNPAAPGSAAHELIMRFVQDPHHSFNPDEAATLARMAIVTASKWQPDTTITISFLDGSATQKKMVKKMAAKWLPLINLTFQYIASKKGMIRISFVHDTGSWSYIGTECLSIPVDEPTMNFGWLRDKTDDAEWERVVVHEFGHALGCIHEHQNPAGGIKWNKPAVYKYYEGPPNNWTKEAVDNNLFRKYAKDQTQFTAVDRASIMMYPIPKEFLLSGDPVGWNLHLSQTDKDFIAETYPKNKAAKKSAVAARDMAPATAAAPEAVMTANLNVIFTNTNPGDSTLTATLNGDSKTITQSGTIRFANAQSGDIIKLQGRSLGTTTITIDVSASPAQMQFDPPKINGNFFIN